MYRRSNILERKLTLEKSYFGNMRAPLAVLGVEDGDMPGVNID
jgi:hypothetical protein